MWKERMERVREKKPLIHNITNYVTANACANILLACGASPIMADDPEEVEEITALCSGLNINIGTLSSRTIPSMLVAGKKANSLGSPVLLDPVGVGASGFRKETVERLLKEIHFTVIRGNVSEIKILAGSDVNLRGVDADGADRVTEENLSQAVALAKACAAEKKTIVAMTGTIDIITDGMTAYCIRNGHPSMGLVTGTGCQLSALTTAYVAANPEAALEAAAAAVGLMGLCGERAFRRMGNDFGNVTYGNYIIDEVCRVTPEELEQGIRYEVR